MENALAIRPMIFKEAREVVDQINSNMNDVRHLVLDLYEREGWTALGYASWRECVVTEFNQNERYLYRQLEAAQTAKQICPIGQKEIPESQLRPLTKLKDNPAQQRASWQQAVATGRESHSRPRFQGCQGYDRTAKALYLKATSTNNQTRINR